MLESIPSQNRDPAAKQASSDATSGPKGTDSANEFRTVLASQSGAHQQSDGDSIEAKVKAATTPDAKQALLDSYAMGFEAASPGGGAANGGKSSPADLMASDKSLADEIAASDASIAQKNDMLDKIASMMATLQANGASSPPAGSSPGGASSPPAGSSPGGASSPPAGSSPGGASSPPAGSSPGGASSPPAGSSPGGASSPPAGSSPGGASSPPAGSSPGGASTSSPWTSENANGVATIHLGDKYTITIDEKNDLVTIVNEKTKQTTTMSSTPATDKNAGDGSGLSIHDDMTLVLDDNTKLTFHMMPSPDGKSDVLTSVVVTNGNNAMSVTGIAGDLDGANNLKVEQTSNGADLDAKTPDGAFTLYENVTTQTWETKDKVVPTQAFVDSAEADWEKSQKIPPSTGSGSDNVDPKNPSFVDPSLGKWTSTVKDGVATIHLGDEYTLTIDEKNRTAVLTNNMSGQVTKVWGDPHINMGKDGSTQLNFHDNMTFMLDHDLKISLQTTPGENGTTYTTSLVITQGDNAMKVTGMAGDLDGKDNLQVMQMTGGRTVDQDTLDGAFTIYEDRANLTWLTGGKNVVDQSFIDNSQKLYEATGNQLK